MKELHTTVRPVTGNRSARGAAPSRVARQLFPQPFNLSQMVLLQFRSLGGKLLPQAFVVVILGDLRRRQPVVRDTQERAHPQPELAALKLQSA